MSTFYTLWNPRNIPEKMLKLMVTMTRSKVNSRSHHDVTHLQPATNVPTQYQLPTPYGFQDILWKILYVKVPAARSDLQPPTNVSTKYQLLTPHGF